MTGCMTAKAFEVYLAIVGGLSVPGANGEPPTYAILATEPGRVVVSEVYHIATMERHGTAWCLAEISRKD